MRWLRAVVAARPPGAAFPMDLVLEPQTAAHALALYPVLCDPAIYRHENQPPVSAAWLLERFAGLESRSSPDGREQWLNWVVRTDPAPGMPAVQPVGHPSAVWVGYVQATLDGSGDALLGYEFGSAWWGRGIAGAAVAAVLDELAVHHGARCAVAVTKQSNQRSQALLKRLGFDATARWPALAGEPAHGECCWTRPLVVSR